MAKNKNRVLIEKEYREKWENPGDTQDLIVGSVGGHEGSGKYRHIKPIEDENDFTDGIDFNDNDDGNKDDE